MRRHRRWLLLPFAPLVLVAPLAACQLIVGFGELPGESAGAEAGAEASTSAPDTGASAADASSEGAPPVCSPTVSFSSDPKNCGRCGRDCLGGACNDGGCQPFALTQGQTHAHWLAVDSTSIVWTDGQEVRGCSKTACESPTTIAAGRPIVEEVATAGGHVFWSECVGSDADAGTGGVFECPSTGCVEPVQPLWSVDRCVIGLAYDAAHDLVYFGAGEFVYRCTPSSCSGPIVVARQQYAYLNSITVADDRVYWLESVRGLSGCTSPLCTPAGIAFLATSPSIVTAPASIVGPNAFWTNYYTGYPTALFNPLLIPRIGNGGSVLRAPINGDGGAAEAIISGGSPSAVVADQDAIRFNDVTSGAILSCPLGGCDGGPTLLAIGQGTPFALVQDEAAIYWANYDDGRIMKLAK